MNPKKKALLWGGYGYGNAGDELTLAAAIADLQSAGYQDLAILTPRPGYTRALFQDLDIISYIPALDNPGGALARKVFRRILQRNPPGARYPPAFQLKCAHSRRWAEAVKGTELLYLVGGGYLSDLFELDKFLAPVMLARHCGVPIQTAPLGLGPFHHDKSIKAFASAFQDAELVVRDTDSLALCKKIGLQAVLRQDDGFMAANQMAESHRPVGKPGTQSVLGVNFFPQHGAKSGKELREWWLAFLRAVSSRNIEIEGFCFHNQIESDFSAMVEIFHEAGLKPSQVRHPDLDFRDACNNLRNYGMVASCRFHAVVVCNAWGIPCAGVSSGGYYSSKMVAACAENDRCHHLSPDQATPEEAAQLVASYLESSQNIAKTP